MGRLGYFTAQFAITLIIVLILALPVMWLWNWLMPLIFGLTKLTFLQALGLNLLTNLLFKSPKTSNE